MCRTNPTAFGKPRSRLRLGPNSPARGPCCSQISAPVQPHRFSRGLVPLTAHPSWAGEPGAHTAQEPAPGGRGRSADNPAVQRPYESQQCRGVVPPPRHGRLPATPFPRAKFPPAAWDGPTCRGAAFLLAVALALATVGVSPGLGALLGWGARGVPHHRESSNLPRGSCRRAGGPPESTA